TDQYLLPTLPAFVDAHVYPLRAPNLRKARAPAKGHLGGGKAVLEGCGSDLCSIQGQILKSDLARIGLAVQNQLVPGTYFGRSGEAREVSVRRAELCAVLDRERCAGLAVRAIQKSALRRAGDPPGAGRDFRCG